jgi:hypothetical protein
MGTSERLPQTLLADSVRVGDQLDRVAAVHLLEPVREELEHDGARLLGALARHFDADAAETRQRNALFSFSKNPSSAR